MSVSGYQFVDNSEFRNEIAKSQSNEVLEQPEVLGDSLLADDHINPDIEEFNRSIWKTNKRISSQKEEIKPASPQATKPKADSPAKPKDTTEILVNINNQKSQAYDCSRYYTFRNNKYVVVEGNYTTWPSAERRLALIKNNSIPSAALAKRCFFPGETGLLIYLGEIYNSAGRSFQVH